MGIKKLIYVSIYILHNEKIFKLNYLDNLNCSIFHISRRVIHTVGPKYAVKYHTAAENALSHCYRSCLELLIENSLQRFLGS